MIKVNASVQVKANPSKTGVVVDTGFVRNERRYVNVKFNNKVEVIPADLLELSPETREDIFSLVQLNKFFNIDELKRNFSHIRLNKNLKDMIYSMEITNTDFYAYQFKPVLKMLNSSSNSLLIADEVGLGKTIEAGLIWTELRHRFSMKKLLILCPGVLREKWKRELHNKIGVKADVVDAKKALEVLQSTNDDDGFALICSMQGIRPQKNSSKDNKKTENKVPPAMALYNYLETKGKEYSKIIDLLVVDEAHYMRNQETQNFKIGSILREVSEYAVFLSATPIQNKNQDLHSLLKILDKDAFEFEDTFQNVLQCNKDLISLREKLLKGENNKNIIIDKLEAISKNELFKKNRQIQQIISEIKDLPQLKEAYSNKLAYDLETINSLGYIYTRTRKRDVQEWRVLREPCAEKVEMSSAEEEFYNKITKTIKNYAVGLGTCFAQFLLCMPQRMMSSSFAATLQVWKKRVDNLQSFDDVDDLDDKYFLPSDFMQRIYDEVEKIDNLNELIEKDTKFNDLLKKLKEFTKNNPNEKIVLFSTFVTTLEYLQRRLTSEGFTSVTLTGKSKDKDSILMEFEKNNDVKILLASEVGSEGVDLQFCRILINYDLPWNPMRVEQRIGRLDRIGQKADKILICNLFHNSTIDERIYTKLYEKLNICVEALGDFEAVLGDEFKNLSVELLSLSPYEQEKRIEQTENAIKNLKVETEKLEQEAYQFTAYGDYILQNISNIKEEDRWISDEDLKNYVINSLKHFYSEVEVIKENGELNKYNIGLPPAARVDFEDFCHRERVLTKPLFLQKAGAIPCLFKNKIKINEKGEVINQFHPMVKFISKKYEEKEEISQIPVAITVESPKLQKGVYLIGASLISFDGAISYDKIIYSGVNVDSSKSLEDKKAESILIEAVQKGKDWINRSEINYSFIKYLSENIIATLSEIYSEELDAINNRNLDRAELQINKLMKHLKSKELDYKNQKESIILKNDANQMKILPAIEGRFNILKNKIEEKIARAERSKAIAHEKQDICVALINVI